MPRKNRIIQYGVAGPPLLLSIVIPTKNSGKTLKQCLDSIKTQTYRDYELIIVDGHSRDGTIEIAKQFTDKIFTRGVTLPAARNFGFSNAKGGVFVSIDSDQILEEKVLEEIAAGISGHGALIIPEVGYGSNFMSRCKDLEKRCYLEDPVIEAARAFTREAFEAVEGYDPTLHFGEDWDIHLRIKERFTIGRVASRMLHSTEHLSLQSDLKKAYLYGKSLPRYMDKNHHHSRQWGDPKRHFFIRHFRKLIKEPKYAFGLTVIKLMEYAAGLAGFISVKLAR